MEYTNRGTEGDSGGRVNVAYCFLIPAYLGCGGRKAVIQFSDTGLPGLWWWKGRKAVVVVSLHL